MTKTVFIALIAVLTAPLAAQESIEEGLVYIEGAVVDQASKEPISRARVSASRTGSVEHFVSETDPSGRFRLRNLEPGDYSLYVEKRGYLGYSHGGLPGVRHPARLALRKGVPIENVRVEMRRPGVLTGRVTDENGQPFIGVRVEAGCQEPPEGEMSCDDRGSVETDDRGYFRMFNLRPGRYVVSAKPPSRGYGASHYQPSLDDPDGQQLRMGYLTTYYPYGFNRAQSTPVEVRNGVETGGIEIRLEPVRTLSVSGQVIRPSEHKAEFIIVSLISYSKGRYGESHTQTYQDTDGRFVFDALPPGEYLLTAGYERGSVRFADWLEFQLVDASLRDVELRPRSGVAVSGRISLDDPDATFDNVRVYVRVEQDGLLSNFTARDTRVSADGLFSIEGVLPGRYRVSVSSHDFTGAIAYIAEAVFVESRPLPEDGLLVSEDSDVRDIDIRIGPAPSLRGIVIGKDLAPVPGAIVVLALPDSEGGFSGHTTSVTNSEGRFYMNGLIPGERVVFAFPQAQSAEGITRELLRTVKPKGQNIKINKGAEEELELDLIERAGR